MLFSTFALLSAMAGPPSYDDHFDLMVVRSGDGALVKVETPSDWAVRRDHVLGQMQEAMGPLPGPEKRVPLDVQVTEESDQGPYRRLKLTYASEPNDRVPAWLLLPKGAPKKAPAVLALHQTIGIGKDEPVGLGGSSGLRYGDELARRGFVVLAPDYLGFGEHKADAYALGYASATMKGIWDHMRGIDLLRGRPEVDPDRTGAIGHSLGGHNALFLAAFDPRVKAVATSCGFTSFPRYKGGDLTGWSHAGYMPRIATIYQRAPQLVPFDFSEVLGAIAPRGLFVSAPVRDDNFDLQGVKDCLESARRAYRLHGAEGGPSQRLKSLT